MLRSLLTKSFAALLLVLAGFNQSFAQAFWSETFSDQAVATANWVNGGTNAGPEDWVWTNDPFAGFMDPAIPALGSPTASSGFFIFNSDANGEFDHDVTLTGVGVPADCSGKSDVRVRFYTQYIHFTETAVAQLGVSTDGTNFTYKNILTDVPANAIFDDWVEVDLPEADGQPQVWLSFRWIGNYEYHWKFDDIEMFEYVAPQYDVTFRVDASLISVDPAGMFLAGTFNGFSDEAMVNEGNGIWSLTKSLTEGQEVLYKFKNGAAGWETGQQACGKPDGFGGFNRFYTPTASTTLSLVCFNSCAACGPLPCNLNPDAIICDKFDTYNPAQRLGPQATWWTTWSGTEGGAEDGIVSTEQAFSAPNSFKLVATAAAGGPQDVVLNLGNKTSGRYALNWKMYLPNGKEGYYNIQNVVPIGAGDWNLDVFFGVGGQGNIQIGAGASLASFSYPYGQWFDVKHEIDLDNNLMSLTINGTLVKKMSYPKNLGGIDFYGTNGNTLYYVDDVEYIQLPAIVFNADGCGTAVDITAATGNAPGVVTTVGPYNITTATLDPSDPTAGIDCHFGADPLQNTHWFTFVGDGNTYNIKSKACGSTPIADNDTQFALYSGDCGNLVPEACNDDVSGSDLSSTITFVAEAGVTYYLMVDSYNGLNGTYCLDIQQFASVDCSQGQVGANSLNNDGFLCFGDNLTGLMAVDPASYTIPNEGPIAGHIWCISTEPLSPNVWPGTIPGIASTTASPTVILVNLPNDGSAFPPGVYYLTSVVVGGGTLIDPAGVSRIFNINIDGGCFYVGESHQLTILPELEPIVAFSFSSPGSTPGNVNIEIEAAGGLPGALEDPSLYQFNWSNGSTSSSLTNVPNVAYTVTISDPSGCADDFVLDITVGTTDPASVKSLSLTPNPTTGLLNVNMSLQQAADVQIEVVNTLGQVVSTLQAGKTTNVNQVIDLSTAAPGMYTVRVRMDNQTAVRRIAVQR